MFGICTDFRTDGEFRVKSSRVESSRVESTNAKPGQTSQVETSLVKLSQAKPRYSETSTPILIGPQDFLRAPYTLEMDARG